MVDANRNEWVAENPDFYSDLLSRKHRKLIMILKQLKTDLSNIKMIFGFLLIGFLIGVGIIEKEWQIGFLGLVFLGVYLYMFAKNIATYLSAPIIEGELKADCKRESKWPGYTHTEAFISDMGKNIPVTVSEKFFKDVISKNVMSKILILYSPSAEYSVVIAARKCEAK